MDKINQLVNKIENENSFEDNIDNIKNLHKMLSKEKTNLNNLYEEVNSNRPSKVYKKYESKSIQELTRLFEDTRDLEIKIKIYNSLTSKINKEINNLIFNDEESSEESE